MNGLLKKLFRKKSILENENTDSIGLKKNLTFWDLSLMGIAAIIGAGVFSTIGKASYEGGVGISFLIIFICITCLFCAFCYAEFAARVPNAGSAYSYIYATLGEFPAWIIGWALILEYSFSNSVLSIAWSSYFNNILEGLKIPFPIWLQTNYFTASPEIYATCPRIFGIPLILNFTAFAFNALITYIAFIGIKEAKWTSHITVIIKLLTISFVIVLGCFYVNPEKWIPIFPNNLKGVLGGTSAIFFAFFGFDSISTMAEESKNPQRDLPRSMIFSLIFCAIIYILICLIITGIAGYQNLNVSDPIAYIFEFMKFEKIGFIISISALFVITSAFIVFQIAQPRIWLSMGRDGLLPKKFSNIHPKYKTPAFGTIITGCMVGIPALFLDMNAVTDLSSIGTLFTFILVCGGVFFLPPQLTKKGFRIPYLNSKWIVPTLFFFTIILFRKTIYIELFLQFKFENLPYFIFLISFFLLSIFSFKKNLSLIPTLGILCCLFLVTELGISNWLSFFVWLILGLLIYFSFSFKNSKAKMIE